MATKSYEVYECYNGTELVYIGQGCVGRHKHCNSGVSHVYELNKLHFEGVVFNVKVEPCATKDEALKIEFEKIQRYNPKLNVALTPKDNRRNKGFEVAKLVAMFKTTARYTYHIYDDKQLRSWCDAFKEYLRHHDLTDKHSKHLPLNERAYYKRKTTPNMFNVYRSYVDTPSIRGKGWKIFDCIIRVFNEQGYVLEHDTNRIHT